MSKRTNTDIGIWGTLPSVSSPVNANAPTSRKTATNTGIGIWGLPPENELMEETSAIWSEPGSAIWGNGPSALGQEGKRMMPRTNNPIGIWGVEAFEDRTMAMTSTEIGIWGWQQGSAAIPEEVAEELAPELADLVQAQVEFRAYKLKTERFYSLLQMYRKARKEFRQTRKEMREALANRVKDERLSALRLQKKLLRKECSALREKLDQIEKEIWQHGN